MKRKLRIKSLIKAAQDTSKNYDLYLEAKTVAENNISLEVPGIEELEGLKDKAKEIISRSSSVGGPETITKEELKSLRTIFQNPEQYTELLRSESSLDVANFCFNKFSRSQDDLEFSRFMFEKYLEYRGGRNKIASLKNYSFFDQKLFNTMLKDNEFLKSSGIIDYMEKRNLIKRAFNFPGSNSKLFTSPWSPIKYLPIISLFYDGYVFLNSLGNCKAALEHINQRFSHLSDGSEWLWEPDTISNLISKYQDDPEKFLEVSYLNNTAQFLFKEALFVILKAVSIFLDICLSFGLLSSIRKAIALASGTIGLGVLGNLILSYTDFDPNISDKFAYAYHTNNGKIISIAADKLLLLKDNNQAEELAKAQSTDDKGIASNQNEELVTVF